MIEEIERYAKENNIPIMLPDGIEFLCNYIKEHNIKNILEIGSAIGYSAIRMAKVSDDIKITTIERDIDRYNIAVSNIKKFNLDNRITIINKDAIEVPVEGKFDLIFIDASKGGNIKFFNKFKDNLDNNGVIITDNLSFHGLVEDETLIKTKNQKGIVRHIKEYIEFLNNNKEFTTTYIPLGDTISISKRKKSKLVVCPTAYNLEEVLKTNIDGIVVGIKDLSVFPSLQVDINKLKEIIKSTSKEIIVSVNKMIHNADIPYLEEVLMELNKLNISKILFYNVGVINIAKRLGITKDLVIMQEHLNSSIYSNNFYYNNGVKGSFISSDITKEELLEIKNNTNMEIMFIGYGYLPIFYSRRYLNTNYFNYINKPREDNLYYMRHNEEDYPVLESSDGSIIYTSKPVNLINNLDEINSIDYIVMDSFNIDNVDFMSALDNFINKTKTNNNEYIGFFNTKTIYKVKNNE